MEVEYMQIQNENEVQEKEDKNETIVSISSETLDSNEKVDLGLSANKDTIKAKLGEIDLNYEAQLEALNKEPVLTEYIVNSKPVSQDIANEAKQEFAAQKADYEQSIKEKYQPKLDELDLKETKINTDLNNDLHEINSDYAKSMEGLKANFIAQGIERSSIAGLQLQGNASEYEKELSDRVAEASNALEALNLKRMMLRNEINSALERFDISKASELDEKIRSITEQYNQKSAEVEKANQEIAKIRRSELQEWNAWVDATRSEINAKKGYEKAKYVIDQMKELNKAESLEILEDPEVKDSLGGWYAALVDYVSRNK